MAQLPVNIDGTYADRSPADHAHQQHHDTLHAVNNALDAVPDGQLVGKSGGTLTGIAPATFDASGAAAAAVEAHRVDTTDVHGIADTAALATSASVTSAVSSAVETHRIDTTDVHGIADTAVLLTPTTFSSHIGSGTGAEVTALDARYLVRARRAAVADAGGTIIAWDDFEGGSTLNGRVLPSGQTWTRNGNEWLTSGRIVTQATGQVGATCDLGTPLSGIVEATYRLGLNGDYRIILRSNGTTTASPTDYLEVLVRQSGGLMAIRKAIDGALTTSATTTLTLSTDVAYRIVASITNTTVIAALNDLSGRTLTTLSYTLTTDEQNMFSLPEYSRTGFLQLYNAGGTPGWSDDFLVRSYA